MPAIETIPRLPLAHLPTPLEPAPRLAEALGLSSLWVKRDDCTGLAMGGNKARKLEYLLGEAVEHGVDTLLTTGGEQSNHARMTAAAACKYGFKCILFLGDSEPERREGNLLLNDLFDAEVRFCPHMDFPGIAVEMARVADELSGQGRKPYIIPVGGSTPVGCLGYVAAVRELAEQCVLLGEAPNVVVAAVGSAGTMAGLLVGARQYLPDCRVVGISVSRDSEAATERAVDIGSGAARLLDLPFELDPAGVEIHDEWLGPGYGIITTEGSDAVRLAARTEGLVLDPVYTGKALAGLAGLARKGSIGSRERVLFWHTGGAPALFARALL